MKSTSFTPPRRLLLGAAFLLAAVSPAHAWWNDDWSLRRELTVDATALAATAPAGADATDARPVLVRLHDGNFQFAQAMNLLKGQPVKGEKMKEPTPKTAEVKK